MKLLADENVDAQIVLRLRADGHDVESVTEEMPGASDARVLEGARQTESLLLTADKDFGELVFLQRRAAHGVLLLGLFELDSNAMADLVASVLLHQGEELRGKFSVLTQRFLRIRSLEPD